MPVAVQLFPHLPRPVDLVIGIPETLSGGAEVVIASGPGRPLGSKTIRTARSRNSGECLLGRPMLSLNGPSDKPGAVHSFEYPGG